MIKFTNILIAVADENGGDLLIAVSDNEKSLIEHAQDHFGGELIFIKNIGGRYLANHNGKEIYRFERIEVLG